MLHLFNKVYISQDDFINVSVNRVVISHRVAPFVSDTSGEVLYHSSTIEELVGSVGTFVDMVAFFTFLFNAGKQTDERVVLYLDKTAYLIVTTAWFHIIFSNIDSTSAYNIIKSNFAKSKLIGSYDNRDPAAYEAFEPTPEEFNMAFATTPIPLGTISTGAPSMWHGISVEFLMASYLANRSYKTELKLAIKTLMTRSIEQLLLEVKEFVYRRAMKPTFADNAGLRDYTYTNVDSVVDDPVIQVLTSSLFWPAKELTNFGKGSNIYIELITDDDISQLSTMFAVLTTANNGHDVVDFDPTTYIKIARKAEMSDEDLDGFLSNERTSVDSPWANEDEVSINIYFIAHLLASYSTPATLTPFILR